MRVCPSAVIVLTAALAWGQCALAGELTEAVRQRQSKIDALLARWPAELPTEGRKELAALLTEMIDFSAMAKAALSNEWEHRGDAERRQYVAAFERLVRASLVRRTDVYRVLDLRFSEETIRGSSGRVKTIVRSKKAETEIVYVFGQRDGSWRLVDLEMDGVSTTSNYRAQFTRILAKNDFQGLLDRLLKRAAALEAEAARAEGDS